MHDRSTNRYSIYGATLGVVLLIVPRRLRWSRRSRRVLRLSAAGLIGVPVIRRLSGWGVGAERASSALVGLVLVGAQYLLSEEDSSVRGAIAMIGGLLVLFALIGPEKPMTEERDV